jgi:hypothetical protein
LSTRFLPHAILLLSIHYNSKNADVIKKQESSSETPLTVKPEPEARIKASEEAQDPREH